MATETPATRASVECGSALVEVYAHDDSTVVSLRGEVDITNVDRVNKFVRLAANAANAMVLDMVDVEFISSQGIVMLLSLEEHCRTQRVNFAVVGSRPVLRLLRIAGEDRVPLVNSVPAALRRLQ